MKDSLSQDRRAKPQVRLQRVLRDEVEGKRTCVLVIGDGFHQQAAQTPAGAPTEWERALEELWLEAGGPREGTPARSQPTSRRWNAIVRQWASHHRLQERLAERKLRSKLAGRLKTLESPPRQQELGAHLFQGRLANLILFSIDRRILPQTRSHRIITRKAAKTSFERHLEVVGPLGRTRVWFPYGETGSPAGIDLGSSGYDAKLMALEQGRARLMDTYNHWGAGFGPGLRSPEYIYQDLWHEPASWTDLVLCAPLVFIGVSLPVDDWPMWWLLHQRARYFVPFGPSEVSETFYLTTDQAEVPHLENGAAGLEIVRFRDHNRLWSFLVDGLASQGIDEEPGLRRRFGKVRRPSTA